MKFILDRRHYLERFLRKISKYDFLLNSEEFLVFSRPNGDIEATFKRVPKLPTSKIYERIKAAVDINEKKYDLVDKERFNNNIVEFSFFVKKVHLQMKNLKKLVETSKVAKRQSIVHSKAFMHLIEKYEELNLRTYVD